MIANVGYIKKLAKTKTKKFPLRSWATINYYKVESKFLDEKNILLQLACGHHPHSRVQATILMPVRELEVKRALHHILYVFFGWKKEQYFQKVELLLSISVRPYSPSNLKSFGQKIEFEYHPFQGQLFVNHQQIPYTNFWQQNLETILKAFN